ncbi:MAG TPA: ferrous iron transport protein B [Acidobacteriota bacterium]|nr:ferrous iron transport protein B [Acidobacteriota bacterium]
MPAVNCSGCPARVQHLTQLGIDTQTADFVVALAGNPNTGKSTVFNALTGLRQHTGNWPGKTVTRAEGNFQFSGHIYKLIDLPGTYSLLSTSQDEEIARDFILFGQPDVTVVVLDSTRLERNLNLVLQILEITHRVVVCLNLMDEARRYNISIDHKKLARKLGVPVIPVSARFKTGLTDLLKAVDDVATGAFTCHPHRFKNQSARLEKAVEQTVERLEEIFPEQPNLRWVALRLLDGDRRIEESVARAELPLFKREPDRSQAIPFDRSTPELRKKTEELLELVERLRWEIGEEFQEELVQSIYADAARITAAVVRHGKGSRAHEFSRRLDRLLTSRRWGFPIMLLLLMLVFWITVSGANYPSSLLSILLIDQIHPLLKQAFAWMGIPWWIDGLTLDGMYLATAWVVSVMLPPMAIFFPLFTLLEDFGYLPRVAFNLDHLFRRVGAHGKQALTMTMGFGCNAAGVVATRIIDSPRERLVAILTNNFSLCNGRWPTQIIVAVLFIGALAPAYLAGLVSALAVVSVALLGVFLTFLVSWLLTRTLLRGEPSTFALELPPYRPPRLLQTLYTSLIDRTIFVLWRAVVFALPAGAVIWLLGNIRAGGRPLAASMVEWLDPLGILLGLNGVILLAYIIAIPANEIVIPTIVMLTVTTAGLTDIGAGAGVLYEPSSEAELMNVLQAGGWTLLTAVNLMLFSLIHNPCSTTLYTIYRETGSAGWTAIAGILPLGLGFLVTFTVAQLWRLFF